VSRAALPKGQSVTKLLNAPKIPKFGARGGQNDVMFEIYFPHPRVIDQTGNSEKCLFHLRKDFPITISFLNTRKRTKPHSLDGYFILGTLPSAHNMAPQP
jgi:hypothetical protein